MEGTGLTCEAVVICPTNNPANLRIGHWCNGEANGETFSVHSYFNDPITVPVATNNILEVAHTLTCPAFQAGDHLHLEFSRYGNDALDTYNNQAWLVGWRITYQSNR